MVENASIATPRIKRKLPPRTEQIQVLQSGEEYDVLVIGGGATGSGVALDAITRGMRNGTCPMSIALNHPHDSVAMRISVSEPAVDQGGRTPAHAHAEFNPRASPMHRNRILCYF